MNGGTEGYCKYPGNPESLSYISMMQLFYTGSRCHTLDRDDFYA